MKYRLSHGSVFAVVVGLVCCSLWSCSSGRETPANVLQVGNGAEVQELDPHLVSGVTEHRVLSALFEGLTDYDPATLEPIPAVARQWTVSDDGLRYLFHLRHDALWSNGDPVTAHDFAYAWQRMLSPNLGSEYAYLLYCLENARAFHEGSLTDFNEVGVRVVDAHTLEATLEHPTPYFLTMHNHYAWFPVNPAVIAQYGAMDERGTQWTRPGRLVGNGPFILTEWRPNEIISVRRNPRYWDADTIRLEGIDFHPIDNQQTEERSFRSGMLHLTSTIPLHRVDVYRRDRPEVLNLHPYYGSYFYRLNVTRPPFDDPRVRRAFALSLDREELTRHVLTGNEQPAASLVPPGDGHFEPSTQVAFDVDQARALLAEAGYPNGQGLPSVEILYNTSEAHRTVAEAVQRMWRENLNADVHLLNQDWKVYLSSMNTLDYTIARSAWIGDVADAVNFLECFQTGVGNNRTGWSSPEFDALIAAAYLEADPDERMRLLQKAEAILLDGGPIIPIYFYTWQFLQAPEVKGLTPNILGYMRWKDIYLDGA